MIVCLRNIIIRSQLLVTMSLRGGLKADVAISG